MGEAKRRRQKLGDHYGQTPPVLMNDSAQLDEHINKFATAYFDKLKKLGKGLLTEYFSENKDHLDHHSSEEPDSACPDMQTYLKNYLEPYRPQDREKLIVGLLTLIYLNLHNSDKDDLKSDEKTGMGQFMIDLTLCIISFNSLKVFLSSQSQEKYGEILRTIYDEMIDEIEADTGIEEEDKAEEKQTLSKLFRGCLKTKDMPIATPT